MDTPAPSATWEFHFFRCFQSTMTFRAGSLKMKDEYIFRVKNHHVESCGAPPSLDEPRGDIVFRSYFENEHGEQWVLIYNAKTDLVTVYSGDCGWENALSVTSLKESLSKLPKEM